MIKKGESVAHVGSVKRGGEKATSRTWHMRMSHAGKNIVKDMCNTKEYSMVIQENTKSNLCETLTRSSQLNRR